MSLDDPDHRTLALWAADCAEHVLSHFEQEYPKDHRPRKAVEAARAWARGELAFARVRAAALAAHAAARAAAQATAARAAARAAGHAAATAHVAGHSPHAAAYAAAAAACAVAPDAVRAAAAKERAWQLRRLPKHLRTKLDRAPKLRDPALAR